MTTVEPDELRDELRVRLDASVRGGIISGDQAARILALDAAPGPAGPAGDAATPRRALVAEAVGYVGAAFALGAVGLLVAEYWSELAVWARGALAALLAVLAVGAGTLLHGRSAGATGAVHRLVGVLWGLGIVASAWAAGIFAWDVIGIEERWMPTAVGGAAALLAAVLLLVGRHVLVQLAGFVALGSAAAGTLVAIAPLQPGALAFGTLILGGGAAWGLAGGGGWLGPRLSAEATGAVAVLVGAQVLTGSAWPRAGLVVAILAALALVGLSVHGGRVHLLYLGAFGLFVSVPRLVIDVFADTLGAPATLLVTGILLILMAVGIGRVRREVHDG